MAAGRYGFGRRTYSGGPSLASADRTVFLEIPSVRAIAFTEMPSARCNGRISAQSSTDSALSSLARPVKHVSRAAYTVRNPVGVTESKRRNACLVPQQ